jgi:transcriptional regulator GlxA family with amidase domain
VGFLNNSIIQMLLIFLLYGHCLLFGCTPFGDVCNSSMTGYIRILAHALLFRIYYARSAKIEAWKLFKQSDNTADIDLLIFPDTDLILLAAVIEPLRAANRISGDILYRWNIMSSEGASAETTSGIPVPVSGKFDPERETAPLFVLASYYWKRYFTKTIKTRLVRTAQYRSIIAGIESGTWFLAESGLLNHSSATIHWEDYEEFVQNYPAVNIVQERYVIDGKRVTTSGPMPTLDLMLEIVRNRQGASLAIEISRLFGYTQPRTNLDRDSSKPAVIRKQIHDPRVDRAILMMENNIEQPLAIGQIAETLGVSTRHLRELFHASLGIAPNLHYLALRLNTARRLVIETPASLTEIATAVGFNSAAAFSRSYRTRFRESATSTRQRSSGSLQGIGPNNSHRP